MSTIRESAQVAYVGDGDQGLGIGDRGRVIAASGSASHVLWSSGSRTGALLLVDNDDLVEMSRTQASLTADSLSDGRLVAVAVRDTYDAFGAPGLLNALNEEGHLASFSAYAEEAMEAVSAKIRQDPSMVEALACLEPEEQDSFVAFTTAVLLRDAFGQEG